MEAEPQIFRIYNSEGCPRLLYQLFGLHYVRSPSPRISLVNLMNRLVDASPQFTRCFFDGSSGVIGTEWLRGIVLSFYRLVAHDSDSFLKTYISFAREMYPLDFWKKCPSRRPLRSNGASVSFDRSTILITLCNGHSMRLSIHTFDQRCYRISTVGALAPRQRAFSDSARRLTILSITTPT